MSDSYCLVGRTQVVPEGDLVLCALRAVGAMDNVAANINAEVAPHRAGLGIRRIGGTHDLAAVDDHIPAFPDLQGSVGFSSRVRAYRKKNSHHGDHGTRREVVDQAREERLLGEILVVLLGKLLGRPDHLCDGRRRRSALPPTRQEERRRKEGGNHLDANELVSLLLEALDDLAHDATLDAVGLNGDEGPLEP